MLMLPLLLALSTAPLCTERGGTAALAVPEGEIGKMLDAHSVTVGKLAQMYYQSGELRADSAKPEDRDLPCEAADIWREKSNANVFGGQCGDPMVKQHLTRIEPLAARQDSIYAGLEFRADSGTQGGTALARELEVVWARVLEQPSPPLMGAKLFPIDNSASPGAENIKITRFLERGEAVIYNGGTQIPTSGLRQASTHVYFRHIVSSANWTMLEQLAWDFSRVNGVQRSLAAARKAIEQLWDKIIWQGSEVHSLYGILNYPYLNRRIVATTFSATADIDSMITEFSRLFTYVPEATNGAALPDSILVGSKLLNFLSSHRLGTGTAVSLLTYLQDQLQTVFASNGGEGKLIIKSVARLNDAGGTGVHGVLVYKNDPDSISLPVSQPVTLLPLFTSGMTLSQIAYMSMGGVVMPNAFSNLLGLVTLG